MSDGGQARSGDAVSRYLAPGGDNVKLIYGLYLVSVVVGLTALIGLVMAYLNRSQVAGSWTESHYAYQIRTFWIGLLYSILCVILMLVGDRLSVDHRRCGLGHRALHQGIAMGGSGPAGAAAEDLAGLIRTRRLTARRCESISPPPAAGRSRSGPAAAADRSPRRACPDVLAA